jgi:hypothetical protein
MSAREREHFDVPLLRGLFYESTSVIDFRISLVPNATIGGGNTREWALANGYGPLKVEPPSARVLAHSLLLPSWNGRDATAETALRLARPHIEIFVSMQDP